MENKTEVFEVNSGELIILCLIKFNWVTLSVNSIHVCLIYDLLT